MLRTPCEQPTGCTARAAAMQGNTRSSPAAGSPRCENKRESWKSGSSQHCRDVSGCETPCGCPCARCGGKSHAWDEPLFWSFRLLDGNTFYNAAKAILCLNCGFVNKTLLIKVTVPLILLCPTLPDAELSLRGDAFVRDCGQREVCPPSALVAEMCPKGVCQAHPTGRCVPEGEQQGWGEGNAAE